MVDEYEKTRPLCEELRKLAMKYEVTILTCGQHSPMRRVSKEELDSLPGVAFLDHVSLVK